MNDSQREDLFEVIEGLVRQGLYVREFLRECEEAWTEAQRRIAVDDATAWKTILRPRS